MYVPILIFKFPNNFNDTVPTISPLQYVTTTTNKQCSQLSTGSGLVCSAPSIHSFNSETDAAGNKTISIQYWLLEDWKTFLC